MAPISGKKKTQRKTKFVCLILWGGEKRMNCRRIERLLSAYIDSTLKADSMAQIKTHLAGCEKCSNELNAMMKVGQLLKLRTKETPSKEYFENYWSRLESKLDRTKALQPSKNRRRANLFIPKFSPAFSGILIALLILVNGFLYMNIQQLTLLQSALCERQEEMQKEIFRYLTKSDNKVILLNLNYSIKKEVSL
jgi:hypothetical protein